MKASAKKLIVAAATAALVGAGTLIAQASWNIPAAATMKAKTPDMPRGVAPSAAKQGGNALVSWSAQEIVAGMRMQKYIVTAHSADVPPQADITRTVSATSADTVSATFSGSDLAGGKWYWTLVPKYELWTGAESKKSDKLGFPAAADRPSVTSLVAAGGTQTPAAAGETTTPPAPEPGPSTPAAQSVTTATTSPPEDKPVEEALPAAPPTTAPAPVESSNPPVAPEPLQ